jgi:hypothetical protein
MKHRDWARGGIALWLLGHGAYASKFQWTLDMRDYSFNSRAMLLSFNEELFKNLTWFGLTADAVCSGGHQPWTTGASACGHELRPGYAELMVIDILLLPFRLALLASSYRVLDALAKKN